MKSIGIIGYGIIGKAVENLFKGKVSIYVYDTHPVYCCNNESDKKKVNNCDIVFVCVPTPHMHYDGLDMSIIESVIRDFSPNMFIICSALRPGTADKLSQRYNKRIVVQPEYFGESINHPLTNLSQQQFLILGGKSKDIDDAIQLYQQVYNANIRIRKVTALEAEVIKLSENRAIAYKVAQCQELYDVCQASGVDYETIRQSVYGDDPRFNLWWTFIYKESRGFNSTCIPKDVYGWCEWANRVGIDPELTKHLIEYNKALLSKHGIKEL